MSCRWTWLAIRRALVSLPQSHSTPVDLAQLLPDSDRAVIANFEQSQLLSEAELRELDDRAGQVNPYVDPVLKAD